MRVIRATSSAIFLPAKTTSFKQWAASTGIKELTPAAFEETIEQDGEPVAALVHDASVLGDPRLVADVAAAARLAVANARLQAQVRSRVAEVAASRRRIVQAADTQRRGLERLATVVAVPVTTSATCSVAA